MLEGRTWGADCLCWWVWSLYWLAGAEVGIVGCGGSGIFGRRGGRIHLWSQSWELLVVAKLLVIGGGGAGNSGLWRSWDLLVGAELGYIGSG